MSSRDTGLTLMIGILAAIVGYILWQLAIGFDTKADDIITILSNSASGATIITISTILVSIGLVVHAAGLISTRGTASGTWETLGIISVVAAIAIWVTTSGFGIALVKMGEQFVEYSAGAAVAGAAAQAAAAAAQTAAEAGNAAGAAAAGAAAQTAGAEYQAAFAAASSIGFAAGFTQAASVASSTIGSLLAGIGWICIGIAYSGSDTWNPISFIKNIISHRLGGLAFLAGLILVVANLVINQLVTTELGSQISGIAFLLIVLWSVLRGIALIRE